MIYFKRIKVKLKLHLFEPLTDDMNYPETALACSQVLLAAH